MADGQPITRDCFMASHAYVNNSFCTRADLQAGSPYGGDAVSNGYRTRSLLRFNLSHNSGDSLEEWINGLR